MPDKEIISLDEAQIAAERFLEERINGIKKLSIEKIQLTAIEGIVIYSIEGVALIGGGFLTRKTECPFKIQVAAKGGAIVGYQT